MDTSNPVADNTRVTIASMRTKVERKVRQNLASLERFVRRCERNFPFGMEDFANMEEWEAALYEVVRSTKRRWRTLDEESKLKCFDFSSILNEHSPIPVSGLLTDGLPIHPPGVNDSKGKVFVAPNFGGFYIDEYASRSVAQKFGIMKAQEMVRECPPHTRGTRQGFQARCLQQLGRSCVQISKEMTKSSFFRLMDKRLPLRQQDLPNWGDDIIA